MSDRYGRRIILLIGLIGVSATMLTFAFIENLTAAYAERFLSGMFAAAVTPGALAIIGDLAAMDEARARRLTFVSLAGISGFLLVPARTYAWRFRRTERRGACSRSAAGAAH